MGLSGAWHGQPVPYGPTGATGACGAVGGGTVSRLRLTPRQAHLCWGLVDGAMDAGSCEEGLTEEEMDAMRVLRKYLREIADRPTK
jgi:hypothetical protein